MTEKEIFEKYNDLSENEVNTKKNKEVYAKNDVMTTVIKHCRGERKIDGFRKKKWWLQNLKFENAQNTKSNQK